MLISETIYRHQVEADVRPFRDILLGLFFVTVGMMLDVVYVLTHLPLLLLAVFLLVAGKGLVVLVVAALTRSRLDVCLRTAAQLAQAGEFGLVLDPARLLVEADWTGCLSADAVGDARIDVRRPVPDRMGGPFHGADFARRLGAQGQDPATSPWGAFSMEAHVIVCGYGRTGEQVGPFPLRRGYPLRGAGCESGPRALPPPEHGRSSSATPIVRRY